MTRPPGSQQDLESLASLPAQDIWDVRPRSTQQALVSTLTRHRGDIFLLCRVAPSRMKAAVYLTSGH